ncbi:serine/threonine protein kinase [Polyangium fumosum]|uniref:Serine/threonine protein kinase n=1 Tax=Polyangium fumosum TaxID=889272 RepID=A0A4U1IMG4_9BACT|nr:serine/threonine-protein kinase [Polyangium fumosum]TKC95251.1 serine/threonine protein kinase [Polyangium fumosum]
MSSDLATGAIFAGRYRVERRIASGGMGAVYEVVHQETNRRRALKVMHANFVQSADLRGRFRQEARVAAEIESEYIVDVFDAGIDEATGMPFLVMELLRGEDLGKRLSQTGPLSPAEALTYLHQTSLALDKTHRAHIVHRDLKPDNLFLCEREDGTPRIKVLDFGIAKIVAAGSTAAGATQSLGTPLYMAPEQFLMESSVTPATDIFALGMISFTLLVGKPYWYEESRGGANVFAFATRAALGPREPATARAARLGTTLPPAFDAWFACATAKAPAERFPSATSAVKALAEALVLPQPGPAGPPLVPPVSPPRPTSPSLPSEAALAPMPAHGTTVPLAPLRAPAPSGVALEAATSMGPPATPMGPVATPIGSGVTAAPATRRPRPTGLIAAGVGLACLLVAIFLFLAVYPAGHLEAPAPAASATEPTEPVAARAPDVAASADPPAEVAPVMSQEPPAGVASAAPPPQEEAARAKAPPVSTSGPASGDPSVKATQPAATSNSRVFTNQDETTLRQQLEPKVGSGRATEQEIRLLLAICRHQRDQGCRTRATAALKQLQAK